MRSLTDHILIEDVI